MGIPSQLAPRSAGRLLIANVGFGLGPLLPSCPVYVRHLERFELGTRYTDIVDHVRRLLRRAPFRGNLPLTKLLVDKTGVGAGVVDSFYERGVRPLSVSIHGGSALTEDPSTNSFRVPKRDLVSAVQVLLQNGTLKIAPDLALAPTLKKELLNFRVKIDPKTAHDSYEHWREGDHDDLVLATALACWYRELTRKEEVREWVWMGGGAIRQGPSEFGMQRRQIRQAAEDERRLTAQFIRNGGKRIEYIDGIPVAYFQSDLEGGTGPVVSDGVVVDESHIQRPDGTGVSVQLHHTDDGDCRNGGGSGYGFYLDMQYLLHLALLGADMGTLGDYAHDLAQEEADREQWPMQGGA